VNAREASLLAVAVPLVTYLGTASLASYWLDSGEFVAGAVWLDIVHPPGHPLAALWSKAMTLLPLGSLAARVAWGQAFAAALAAGFLFAAIHRTLRATRTGDGAIAIVASLAGTWLVAFSYGWWFQAVRPEVYALELLCIAVAVERLTAFEVARKQGRIDAAALCGASLALGLGLANHHLMAVLALPALGWCALGAARAGAWRGFSLATACGVLGCMTYTYLPARASTQPPIDLGDPVTLDRAWWVVSAQVYAREMGGENPQPLFERYADLLVAVVEGLHPVGFLFAVVGLYLFLRRERLSGLAPMWLLVLAVNFGVRMWLGPVRANPDVLGSLGPGFAVLGMLVAVAVAAIGTALRSVQPRAAFVVPALALVLSLAQLVRAGPASALGDFGALAPFDALRVDALPARAVVIASVPQTVFRHWERAATGPARPDVTLIPLPFLRYPGVREGLRRHSPDVNALVDDYLAHDALTEAALLHAARSRPVLVEIDARLDPSLYPLLSPSGLLHRVGGVVDRNPAARTAMHAALSRRVAPWRGERETARQLLWTHYIDAVFHAGRGELAQARAASARGLQVQPRDERLLALDAALAKASHGPLDVTPFLRF
jgi:hypothetical protein